MALDHYVSQVHLKNFYSPDLGEAFYALRKNELRLFSQNSAGVCRIESNSTNTYLKEDRIVEEFLKDIEPNYNHALGEIKANNVSVKSIYVIAGFVAYVLTCSPAGMRIHSNPLKAVSEETLKKLDLANEIPIPPKSLGSETLLDLIENGKIKIKIDPKYPQAIGISNILDKIKIFGNSKWEILINSFDDSPFFTSDFPVVIEKTQDRRILNRIIPLSPFVAIRICPDLRLDREKIGFDFSAFRSVVQKLSRKDVAYINQEIVRCAETVIFFRDNLPWISQFVKRNAKFHIEPKVHKIQSSKGTLLWFTQEIVNT